MRRTIAAPDRAACRTLRRKSPGEAFDNRCARKLASLEREQTRFEEGRIMSQEISPRLSHVGIYVTDLPKMIDFYTNVLGFVVSDAALDGRITFLSRNPSDHHQVVLVPGRKTDPQTPMVQQISFNVGTLANVHKPSVRCAPRAAKGSIRCVTATYGR